MSEKSIARPVGRPTLYTPELAKRIVDRYASGEPLRAISADPEMPDRETIRTWRKKHPEFSSTFARARKAKAEWHAEQGRATLAKLTDKRLKKLDKVASAAVGARREQANYDKWLASVLDRDTYGDRQQVDLNAKVLTLHAFADVEQHAHNAQAAQEDNTHTLPHVAAPDGSEAGEA